jgi:hypothetical protein
MTKSPEDESSYNLLHRRSCGALVTLCVLAVVGHVGNALKNRSAYGAGRCFDNAVYFGLGIAAIFIMPHQKKRKLEAGKITEEKAKKHPSLYGRLVVCASASAFYR